MTICYVCRQSIGELPNVYYADHMRGLGDWALGTYFGFDTFQVYTHGGCALECEAILMLLGVPWKEVVKRKKEKRTS